MLFRGASRRDDRRCGHDAARRRRASHGRQQFRQLPRRPPHRQRQLRRRPAFLRQRNERRTEHHLYVHYRQQLHRRPQGRPHRQNRRRHYRVPVCAGRERPASRRGRDFRRRRGDRDKHPGRRDEFRGFRSRGTARRRFRLRLLLGCPAARIGRRRLLRLHRRSA